MLTFCTSLEFSEESIEWIEVAGASARKLNDKYIQMLEDIKNKIMSVPTIKSVAFWHLNRLGRIESKLMEMKEWFISNRIQVFIKNPTITLFEDVNTGRVSPSAEIAWAIFSTTVKFETQEMFEKMIRGKRRNAQNKKYNGGIHIKTGYKVDENNYIVPDYDSSDYLLVQLIYSEFATGKWSTMTLAKELRARGIKKANGEWVSFHFINNLMHDTSYIGYSSKYGCDRIYDPIISNELFEKCQKVLKSNNTQLPKSTVFHYFGTKLIKCPKCGYHFVAQAKTYHCFRHSNRAKYDYSVDNDVCDNSINIGIHVIDGWLWRIAGDRHMEYLLGLKEENKETFIEKINILNQKIKEANRLIADVESKKLRIQEGYDDGIYAKEVRDQKLIKVESDALVVRQRIVSYSEEIARHQKSISEIDSSSSWQEKLKDAMITTDNISDEIEMYDIVHQHIKVVYAEALMIKDKKTAKLTVEFHDGTVEYYLYFMWAKKGMRVYKITKEGYAPPVGFQNIIRNDSNSQDLFAMDINHPAVRETKNLIEETIKDKNFMKLNFPYLCDDSVSNSRDIEQDHDSAISSSDE